jgi:hypothetical protein
MMRARQGKKSSFFQSLVPGADNPRRSKRGNHPDLTTENRLFGPPQQ